MAQPDQLQESQLASKQETGGSTLINKCSIMNCSHCDYSSTNKHYLRQHIDLVHSTEKPFKCPFCDYAGKRSHSLKEHLIVHSDERPFKCSHCNAKFRKKGHLTNHNRMHAESQTTPTCLLCKAGTITFASHDELYLHLRSAHLNRRDTAVFCCTRCNYATTVKGNLQIHEMGHNDYRHVVLMKPKLPPSACIILKCSDCGFETSQRHELEEHVMTKHYDADEDDSFEECASNNNIPNFRKLLPAIKPRTRVGSHLAMMPKYKCSECGYVTADEKLLLGHALQHSFASKNAELQSTLGMNEGTDSNLQADGSYVCTICSYYCDTQRTLKAHMWKHLGHKNLQYPTFQNGPLSVYDGTPLAAKNFVRRVSAEAQQSSVTQEHSENNAILVKSIQGWSKDFESRNEIKNTQPSTSGGSPTAASPFPQRVVVQSIQRVPDMNTTSCDIEVNEEFLAAESVAAGRTDIENSNAAVDGNDGCADGDAVAEVKIVNADAEVAVSAQKIDASGYSATEKTAATLLSLLRQGPNVNPACPPPGYYAEMREAMEQSEPEVHCGSDSAIVDDVAGEEVVGTASVNSSPPSEIQSIGKPKKGICSSLLAVIEQLRQRQAEESPASGIRSLRKRKHISASEEAEDSSQIANDEATEKKGGVIDSSRVVYRCKPYQLGRSSGHTSPVEDTKHKTDRQDSVEIDVCPANMNAVLDADQVLAAAHGVVVYRCELCHYRSSSHLMRQHMKVHKKKKPHECSLCDFVASSTSLLQDHMIQHCKMRQFQCKLCSTVFNYKSQLRAHTRVHEDGQAFYCEHCEYVTSYLDCFQEHLNQHSETITSFSCIACREAFSELVNLQIHMKESCMEVKKLYKTNLMAASQPSSMKASDPTSRTLKCDQCEFVALSIRSLKSHLKRHINDKRYIQQPLEQYKCNLCGYVCHHMPSLKSHMWRHANDSDFSYSFNDLLADTSKAVDKKGKPLITLRCCQCGYETLQKAELDKHMKRHWDIIKKTYDVGSIVGSSD